jgi:hypothetical protein
VLDLPLAGAARVRLARGGSPGRIGAAVAFHVGRLEISVGRLDYAAGMSVSGAMVGLRARNGARSALDAGGA